MAYKVLIADEARRSLTEAVAYISTVLCEPSAAAKLADALESAIDSLSDLPELYPLCAEKRLAKMGLRKILCEGYVALYLVEETSVSIIAFFHQSQDYAKLL